MDSKHNSHVCTHVQVDVVIEVTVMTYVAY